MDQKKLKVTEKNHIMQSYGRFDLVIEQAKGMYVYDTQKKKYLDLVSGLACVPLGHSNPEIKKAITTQLDKVTHVSNLYYTIPQINLAKKLSEISGLKKVFFCNSGAESNEAAIKLAKKITKKTDFICAHHAFHGRTSAALSATSKEKYKKPFLPLVEGFSFVEYNNPSAIENAITNKTAAVILEPIQGEAGIIIPDDDYLKEVSVICKKHNILLILDEVQTGNGRTGKYFAYQHYDIKPDIITTAKGLANGLPLGVCLSNFEFDLGEHATTFGGNCITCSAALTTIDLIEKNKLTDNTILMGKIFHKKLLNLKSSSKKITDIRVKGLMIGFDILTDAKKFSEYCLKKGLLVNNATDHTIRLLPPLIIKKEHIKQAVEIIKEALQNV